MAQEFGTAGIEKIEILLEKRDGDEGPVVERVHLTDGVLTKHEFLEKGKVTKTEHYENGELVETKEVN